jgi:hypothetical protein
MEFLRIAVEEQPHLPPEGCRIETHEPPLI